MSGGVFTVVFSTCFCGESHGYRDTLLTQMISLKYWGDCHGLQIFSWWKSFNLKSLPFWCFGFFCCCCLVASVVSNSCATLWIVACQASLSVHGILPRQEYWSGLPCPPPGYLPNPGIEPGSPALQVDSLSLSHQGSPLDFSGSSQSWCSELFQLLDFQVQQTQWMEKGTD